MTIYRIHSGLSPYKGMVYELTVWPRGSGRDPETAQVKFKRYGWEIVDGPYLQTRGEAAAYLSGCRRLRPDWHIEAIRDRGQ